jgi:FkbM family methyltransferase
MRLSNMNLLSSKIGPFNIFYNNQKEFESIYKEIFINGEYNIALKSVRPLIIDCGSHIGLSVLFIKSLYPHAKIIGFEPNPVSYLILKKNIKNNQLRNIKVYNTALTGKKGSVDLYSYRYPDGQWNWDNSLISNLWTGKKVLKKYKVKSTQLSNVIKSKVDLVKIDIEGSEVEVLSDLANKLYLIENLFVECHITKSTLANNSYYVIRNILINNGFFIWCKLKDGRRFVPNRRYLKNWDPNAFALYAKAYPKILKMFPLLCSIYQRINDLKYGANRVIQYND